MTFVDNNDNTNDDPNAESGSGHKVTLEIVQDFPKKQAVSQLEHSIEMVQHSESHPN